MYLRVHGSQESRNKSLKKSNFILFFPSFSYKTLVKDSLPTKALLELIYTQNNIAFAACGIHLDLLCLQIDESVSFHWQVSLAVFRQVQTAPHACAVYMQHMLHSLLEVVVVEVLTESLSIPLSSGSPLLGRISTNLFLSRFVVTVPWHVETLSSQHQLLIISVSKAELFVHDTCRMWSHCKHVTCMTSSSPLMKGSSEIILIPTTCIMHGTILLMETEKSCCPED